MKIQIRNNKNKGVRLVELNNLVLLGGEIAFIEVNDKQLQDIQNTPYLEIIKEVEKKEKKSKKEIEVEEYDN